MRTLILKEIQQLKTKENGFENSQWDDFFINGWHISIVPFDGMPDIFLLFAYNSIMSWNSEYIFTGKAPIVTEADVPDLEELRNERKTKTGKTYDFIKGYTNTNNTNLSAQILGRINRQK